MLKSIEMIKMLKAIEILSQFSLKMKTLKSSILIKD